MNIIHKIEQLSSHATVARRKAKNALEKAYQQGRKDATRIMLIFATSDEHD